MQNADHVIERAARRYTAAIADRIAAGQPIPFGG
jgi:hypothetical protein